MTRVTLVHDYLTQRGGAERVVLELLRAFPSAVLHTALWNPDGTFPEFGDHDVRVSPLNRVRAFRQDHRRALPLLAATFSKMPLEPADAVLCSSSGWAHGVHTARTPKVVYCHTPARWLHTAEGGRSIAGGVGAAVMRVARQPLMAWDARSAAGAARYLANSHLVRQRIRSAYGIDAQVIQPSPGLLPDGPEQAPAGVAPGYFLTVARLAPYKNVDVVVDAARHLPGARLVVVGGGPLLTSLRQRAPHNVEFRHDVPDAELRWLYRNAAALVTASQEDFGLTPLEANAFGRPVVALRAGGHLETVLPGVTGLLVDDVDPDSFARAMAAAAHRDWSGPTLTGHAGQFSRQRFDAALHDAVGRAVDGR